MAKALIIQNQGVINPKAIVRKCTVFLGFLVLFSCQEQPIYEKYLSVNAQGWHADSTAKFEVSIEDTTAAYVVVFNLRANDNYPYSNLYLFREIKSEGGLEYQDTALVTLADQYGRWLGDGLGELKTFSRPYRAQPLLFKRQGKYTFSFTHAMRHEVLQGVEDVGLTLYKNENGEDE